MRLVRFGAPDGTLHVGVVSAGGVVPVGDGTGRAGQELLLRLAMGEVAPAPALDAIPLPGVRLLAPIPDPPSVRDFYAFEAHVRTARESRGVAMDEDWYQLPVFYFSNPASIIGPDEDVGVPGGSQALDFELEVAAVIGREVVDGGADDCLAAVAGFVVMNDWSARDLQRREMRQGLGPAKGKDFATSLGPWLTTPDELPGLDTGRPAARMVARVNGEQWSEGNMADIHFSWGELLAHACRDTRLRPGDVIGSGTVGTGCVLELQAVHGPDRYRWLRPGDEVELEVEHLGALRNRVTG